MFNDLEKAALAQARANLVLQFAGHISGHLLSAQSSLPPGDARYSAIWANAEKMVDAMPEGILRLLADMPEVATAEMPAAPEVPAEAQEPVQEKGAGEADAAPALTDVAGAALASVNDGKEAA